MYLKKAIGIYYQDDQLDIEVAGKSMTGMHSLGSLTLTGTSEKDSVLLKAEVKSFLEKIKTDPDNVLLALSPEQVVFRHLTLPIEAEENLDQAVRLQIMNYIPSEPDDYHFEKVVHKLPEQKSLEIDLYLIPKEKVRKILDLAYSIGLPPVGIVLTAFGFERLFSLTDDLLAKPVFLADLDTDAFSIYVFTDEHFSYFKQITLNPENRNLDAILQEVEHCASAVRCPDDSDLEIFANISDPVWQSQVVDEKYAFIHLVGECSPVKDQTRQNLKSFAVAILALDWEPKTFNLIPPEWREKSSSMSLLPTLILIVLFLLALVANFGWIYLQESRYLDNLSQRITKVQKDYRSAMQLRASMLKVRKEIDTYSSVIHKPRTDLEILRELTEKTGEKTFLNEYVRTDRLIISGLTDSVLDLQVRLSSIQFLKNISLQGSITKTKEGLEHFRFEIQLEE